MGESVYAKRVTVTLCGVKQAERGFKFIHLGPAQVCRTCDLFHVCMGNLETGRVYKVVKVRDKTFTCKVHEGGVRVVEVQEAEVDGVVEVSMAIDGAVVTFHPQNCGRRACENFNECNPEGLLPGDKCKIVAIYGRMRCPEGRLIQAASLLRQSA